MIAWSYMKHGGSETNFIWQGKVMHQYVHYIGYYHGWRRREKRRQASERKFDISILRYETTQRRLILLLSSRWALA
jgi:hypothetical protein